MNSFVTFMCRQPSTICRSLLFPPIDSYLRLKSINSFWRLLEREGLSPTRESKARRGRRVSKAIVMCSGWFASNLRRKWHTVEQMGIRKRIVFKGGPLSRPTVDHIGESARV